MIKKIIIVLLILQFSVLFGIIPRTGFSDEAIYLNPGTYQIGGVAYLESNLFQNIFLTESPYSLVFVPSAPTIDPSDGKPILSAYYSYVPYAGSGFIFRAGLKRNREFYFSTSLTSPNMFCNNIYGPGVLIDFGWKFHLIKYNQTNLSYKLTILHYYNGQPGGGISLKNALLVGTDFKFINFTGIFNYQFGLTGNFPWFSHFFSTRYFTMMNGLGAECALSFALKSNVVILFGGYIQYLLEVDFGDYFYPLKNIYFLNESSIYAKNKLYGYLDVGIDFSVSYKFEVKQKR